MEVQGLSTCWARARARGRAAAGVVVAAGVLVSCQPDEASGDTESTSGAEPSEGTAVDDGDSGSDETGDGGDSAVLVGSFQLQLTAPMPETGGMPATSGGTTLFGKLYDGPTPPTLVWELAMEAGGCRLLTPRVPFCNTPCGGAAACVEDDTCQDYPSAQSAGEVLVTGVATTDGASSFSMMPIANNYQPPAGTTLAYPAFAEGDTIEVAASGDMVAAFEISATGVAPLELQADEVMLDPAVDVVLGWVPAGTAESTIAVALDISHHGGTKGIIECEAEDSGSLVIPAALVSGLLDLGVAGFPTIVVTRASTGSTTTAIGRIDLVVSSQVVRSVLIDGLVSCTDDAECPEGQTCQVDLACR